MVIEKNKAIFILVSGIAILIASLISLQMYKRLQRDKVVTSVNADILSVAVAARDLSWGTCLSRKMIKMSPFLKASLPQGYFSEISSLEGRTLIYPLKAGEPIFETKLAPITIRSGGIAAVITPKKRAMSVKVDKVIGVSGFIKPGNRVDILVTMAHNKEDIPITKTVLENTLVLATGTELETDEEKERPRQVDVITLEVTPEEGEKLALATTLGKIQLALRNAADNEDVITRGTTIQHLLHEATKELSQAADVTQSSDIPDGNTMLFPVQLIKGIEVSELLF